MNLKERKYFSSPAQSAKLRAKSREEIRKRFLKAIEEGKGKEDFYSKIAKERIKNVRFIERNFYRHSR